MEISTFRKHAHEFVDWMADYLENVRSYPVKSNVAPGAICEKIPQDFPLEGDGMEAIFADFNHYIMPGVTHWQSPNYYAYFQANSSPPSVLAEMLTATLGIQAMKWETSPAAAELEEAMMRWLMRAMAIPESWTGVIQDTASTATLTAIITAREQLTGYRVNATGLFEAKAMRVYCSKETHSSIEKGAKIAGIGSQNVVKVGVDEMLAMRPDKLREAIEADQIAGLQPLCIVVAIGTTGTMAVDPIGEIANIAEEFGIWLHVDAAYAGSVLLLPEYHYLNAGIELADSFVFNPHKWLFTNFDCCAYFVKDQNALVNTFAILPEYLRTRTDGHVNNYCDWGVPLGRRFRALKLWFVFRYYGLTEIQAMLRAHIEHAQWLEQEIHANPDFKMVLPRALTLVCFRYEPRGLWSGIDNLNESLMHKLNDSGKLFLTHTRVAGKFTLRMSIGQTQVTRKDVESAWATIRTMAAQLATPIE